MNILSCEHPQRIYNMYLNEYMFVPCGQCCVCKNRLSHNWVKRLEVESKCHQYTIFFTLTYSNKFVPTVQFIPDKMIFVPIQNFHTCIEVNDFLDEKSKILLENDCFLKVLSVRQVQLFVKRLRRQIDYAFKNGKINEKNIPNVRYYINGEYGPTTFRPHHHGLLWTDSKWVADNFNELLIKAWSEYDRVNKISVPLGNVDWSFAGSESCKYVAQYVNSFSGLPTVFTASQIKPFSVKSKHPAIGTLFQSDSQIQEIFHKSLTEVSFPSGNGKELISYPLLPSFENRLFPKCLRFSSLSHPLRVAIYSVSERFLSEETFRDEISWQSYIIDELKLPKFGFLLDYIREITFDLKDLRPFIRCLHISSRVVSQAAVFGCSVDYYVSRIENHYDNKSKRNLRDYFTYAEVYSKEHSHYDLLFTDLEFIERFYNHPQTVPRDVFRSYSLDLFKPIDYTSLDCYKNLIQLNKQIYMKNCKTKKKNDYLLAHPELAMFNQI